MKAADKEKAIVEVITRKPVPPGQLTLYKALYESPEGLSKAELAKRIRSFSKHPTMSLGGVLGALSRRVKGTQSLDKFDFKFLIKRDRRKHGDNVYQMRSEVRKVIESHPKLDKLRTVFGYFDCI